MCSSDLHYGPGALRRAVAWTLAQGWDHLSLGPRLHARTLLGRAGVATFGGLFLSATQASRLGQPDSDAYVGVGAFNLVRRSALTRTEGWPWLRLEVADDMGLALLLRRHGARAGFAMSRSEVAVEWYASQAELIAGLEKNAFAVLARFQWWRCAALLLLAWTAALGPLLAWWTPAWWLAAAAWLGLAAVAWRTQARYGLPWLPTLLVPVSLLALSAALVRSAWATWRQGGISWRGTTYPLAELRRNQKVFL